MPPILPFQALDLCPSAPAAGCLRALQAGGTRPALEEEAGADLPPAGAARAEQIFEVTGSLLVLVILLSALIILLRRRG